VVTVRTIMAGDPVVVPDTPLIRDLHQRWDAGDNPMKTRREEDERALHELGVTVEHLLLPDCPYRVNAAGQALYAVNASLFGAIHPDDPALKLEITLPEGVGRVPVNLYAPLGAGGHVDHLIVRELVYRQFLAPTAVGRKSNAGSVAIFFYEEYPYSANSGEALHMDSDNHGREYGSAAVQSALDTLPVTLQPDIIPLSDADLNAKIRAIACYQSQISTFWDNPAAMDTGVRRYAQEVDPACQPGAERLWRTITQPSS